MIIYNKPCSQNNITSKSFLYMALLRLIKPLLQYMLQSHLSCISVHAYATLQHMMPFLFSKSTLSVQARTLLICPWFFNSLSQLLAVYSNQQYRLNYNYMTVMYLFRDHNSLIRCEQFLETEEFFVSFAKLPHSKKCWVRGGLKKRGLQQSKNDITICITKV